MISSERNHLISYKEKTDLLIKNLESENKTLNEKFEEIERLFNDKKKECENLWINLKSYIDKISKGNLKITLLE